MSSRRHSTYSIAGSFYAWLLEGDGSHFDLPVRFQFLRDLILEEKEDEDAPDTAEGVLAVLDEYQKQLAVMKSYLLARAAEEEYIVCC
jgi:hypothetical protein